MFFVDSADALPRAAVRLPDEIETGDLLRLPVPGLVLVHLTAVQVEITAVTADRRHLLRAKRKGIASEEHGYQFLKSLTLLVNS